MTERKEMSERKATILAWAMVLVGVGVLFVLPLLFTLGMWP